MGRAEEVGSLATSSTESTVFRRLLEGLERDGGEAEITDSEGRKECPLNDLSKIS